ncbi:hypothetical protein BKA67DRAFT_525315 [Truncatella angustata]|uniref:Uncharacterized protein n=1 Tax=Truncatella angustata TaxID=152316 RepID=A0A9P8UC22_9PEZI|nr:uncharacterized protein BKA67DRAFT_525315 [Truncatella angustata]KAH6646847.1 hypothetical protein BKA67DRAFT_525315 [Truncatella angustata]
MSNPNKHKTELDSHNSYVDQDIFWCLDSLQAFCRLQGPTIGERDLSFSFGTCPDRWMYFHFTLHYFFLDTTEVSTPIEAASDASRSGLRCDRLNMTIPGIGRLEEMRLLVSMRVATRYGTKSPTEEPSPSAVGFVMTDAGHSSTHTTRTDWTGRGLQSPMEASGVTLFQTMIWNLLDLWEHGWSQCLDAVDALLDFQSDDLSNEILLEAQMFDDERMSKTKHMFLVLRLFANFRKNISTPSQTIRRMQKEWAKAYKGRYSDRLERFDRLTQVAILENWDRVILHSDRLHAKLLDRIRSKEEDCRNYRDGVRFNF